LLCPVLGGMPAACRNPRLEACQAEGTCISPLHARLQEVLPSVCVGQLVSSAARGLSASVGRLPTTHSGARGPSIAESAWDQTWWLWVQTCPSVIAASGPPTASTRMAKQHVALNAGPTAWRTYLVHAVSAAENRHSDCWPTAGRLAAASASRLACSALSDRCAIAAARPHTPRRKT